MTLAKAVEATAVVHLLVMRISPTTNIDFVLLKLFRVSLGVADKSLPDQEMSAGMVDESTTRRWMKLEIPHLALRWHVAKYDV